GERRVARARPGGGPVDRPRRRPRLRHRRRPAPRRALRRPRIARPLRRARDPRARRARREAPPASPGDAGAREEAPRNPVQWLVLLCVAATAAAEEPDWTLKLEAGTEVDSNVHRAPSGSDVVGAADGRLGIRYDISGRAGDAGRFAFDA